MSDGDARAAHEDELVRIAEEAAVTEIDVEIDTMECRATGGGQCVMSVLVRPAGAHG